MSEYPFSNGNFILKNIGLFLLIIDLQDKKWYQMCNEGLTNLIFYCFLVYHDHSGVTMWVVPTPRPILADLMLVSFPSSSSVSILPPGLQSFYHFGTCTKECLQPVVLLKDSYSPYYL